MPIINGYYQSPEWQDEQAPAINGDNLNDLTQSLELNQYRVGDIRYSYRTALGNAYLRCDGSAISSNDYPALVSLLASVNPPVSSAQIPTISGYTVTINSIASNGTDTIVAVGNAVNGSSQTYPYFAYSTDNGSTWTGSVRTNAVAGGQASAVKVKYLNGRFVCAMHDASGYPYLVYCTSGAPWDFGGNMIRNRSALNAVDIITDGSKYIALYTDSLGTTVLASASLTNTQWAMKDYTALANPCAALYNNGAYYIFGQPTNSKTQALVGSNYAYLSLSVISSSYEIANYAVAAYGNTVVAVGNTSANVPYVCVYNGSTWSTTRISTTDTLNVRGVAYSNGVWCVAATNSTTYIQCVYRSTDLTTWTKTELSSTAINATLSDVAVVGSYFYAATQTGVVFKVLNYLGDALLPDITATFGYAYIKATAAAYTAPAWANNASPYINASNLNNLTSEAQTAQIAIGDIVISAAQTPPTGFLELAGQIIGSSTYPSLTALVNAFNGQSGNTATLPVADFEGQKLYVRAV